MPYEKLLREARHHEIDIYEKQMPNRIKGLYADNVIWINKNMSTYAEKNCVIAEELGHYHTSFGDILDQSKLTNRKQEILARSWAYKKLVPLDKIISAYQNNIRSRYELAEYLNVTEAFLLDALKRYKEEYGLSKTTGEYTIFFEPLAVLRLFEGSDV